MMNNIKEFIKKVVYQSLDVLFVPLTLISARFSKFLRRKQFKNLPLSRKIFLGIGVYPIMDHYYDPLFNPVYIKKPLDQERYLPGIDLNVKEQLSLLEKFSYNDELVKFPMSPREKKKAFEYTYADEAFRSGDAEYLYSMIRFFKPARIIEIGSGSSTLMARNAIDQNVKEDASYQCGHICIEPYENHWLESLGVEVHRKLVENIDHTLFKQLKANDILFIDSSHMIRPQGDVLMEYLEILPVLNAGVLVHIHDIFTPRDYLAEWVALPYFWNEQYLLEALLTNNKGYEIIGALNYLRHNFYNELAKKCPALKSEIEQGMAREPGSFWLKKL